MTLRPYKNRGHGRVVIDDETEVRFDAPQRRSDGHVGTRARVVTKSGEWHGQYEFDTHGMTSGQVTDHAIALRARHAAKADKLTEYRDALSIEIAHNGVAYRVVDCTIRGDRDELYIDVWRVDSTPKTRSRIPGFPLQLRYHEIAQMPSVAAIAELVRAALPADAPDAIADLHSEFVGKVNDKLSKSKSPQGGA